MTGKARMTEHESAAPAASTAARRRFFQQLTLSSTAAPLTFLLIPLLVLWGDRSILFNPVGSIDPWVYYALIRHPARMKHLFFETYYGSRISFILPGYIVNRLLPPLSANYAFHLLVWLTAMLSLYLAIKSLADRRTALLSIAVFGFYPYLWKAVGWDYTDGGGIAYYLVAAALLTIASSRPVPSRVLLMAAGAAGAGALYSNLCWAFLLPFLGVGWLVLRRIRGYSLAFPTAVQYVGAGAILATLALAIANHRLDGQYGFYRPSINYALGMQGKRNPGAVPVADWITRGYWLILPGMGVLAGIPLTLRLWRTRRSFSTQVCFATYGFLLLCAGTLSTLEFCFHGAELQLSYYASYLIPSAALFFGVSLLKVPQAWTNGKFYLLLAVVIACSSIVWFDRREVIWLALSHWGWTPPLLLAASGILVGIVWRGTSIGTAGALVGLCVIALSSRSHGSPAFTDTANRAEMAFDRIVESFDACEAARQGRKIAFWVTDRADPYADEFTSIASLYFYGYTLLPGYYPNLAEGANLSEDTLVVIPSRNPIVQSQAQAVLRSEGLDSEILSKKTISKGDRQYILTFILTKELDSPYTTAISNPDFESGVKPWFGGEAALRTVDGGQSGKCLELEAKTASSQYAMLKNALKLVPGARYKLSVWVKSGSAGNEPFQIGIWNGHVNRFEALLRGRSTTAWTEFDLAFTPQSRHKLSVALVKNSSTLGTMLFDSVQVSPLD